MQLKQIIENMDSIPSRGFDEPKKLTTEEKRKLMDMVGRYNDLGKCLRMEEELMNTAKSLAEISTLAETYACNEAQDWFDTQVVQKDFKRIKNDSGEFQKIAKECYSKMRQLNAIYENIGILLERYYEIADPVAEVAPNVNDLQSQEMLPRNGAVQEVSPNTSDLQSQHCLPRLNGPAFAQIKETTKEINEVAPNVNDLKSQRELPSGGPTTCKCPNPENPSIPVKVAGAGENVKGERNVPQGGPQTAQIKENKSLKMMDIIRGK